MSGEEPSEKLDDETWIQFVARIAHWAFVRFRSTQTKISSDAKLLVRGGLAIAAAGIVMLAPSYVWEIAVICFRRLMSGEWPAYEPPGFPSHIPGLLVVGMGAVVAVTGAHIGARWPTRHDDIQPAETRIPEPEPARLTRQQAAAWRKLSSRGLVRQARRDFIAVGECRLQPTAIRTHTEKWLELLNQPEAMAIGTKFTELVSALKRVRRGIEETDSHDLASDTIRAAGKVGRMMASLDLGAAKALETEEDNWKAGT